MCHPVPPRKPPRFWRLQPSPGNTGKPVACCGPGRTSNPNRAPWRVNPEAPAGNGGREIMSKKHTPQPRPAHSAAPFPAASHVATNPQREIPNPAAALAELSQPQPSERARLRAATVQHEQREARARREAQQILAAADRPAPTVREDLQAVRRRPWDAPMATPVHQMPQPPAPMICGVSGLPDPLATLAWDAVVEDAAEKASRWWGKWQLTLAFSAWSLACFSLGVLAR